MFVGVVRVRTDGGDQQSKPNCSVSRLWVARSRVCVYGVQLSYIGSTPRSRSTSSSKSRFVTISRVPRNKQKKKPHFFPPCGSCSQQLERKHVTIENGPFETRVLKKSPALGSRSQLCAAARKFEIRPVEHPPCATNAPPAYDTLGSLWKLTLRRQNRGLNWGCAQFGSNPTGTGGDLAVKRGKNQEESTRKKEVRTGNRSGDRVKSASGPGSNSEADRPSVCLR